MQPVDAVQTSEEPDWLFEVASKTQAHTASAEVVAAVFAYAEPALHTVTIEGQEVTGELDDSVVDDAANVPLAHAVQIALDVSVAEEA